MSEPPRLEAESVGLRIEAAQILDRVSLRAAPGELIGLIGPNGAGKSSLIRALSGLVRPSGGSVRLDGVEVERLSPREIARIVAHLPQATVLDFGFTCLEVVLMGRHPHLGRFALEGPDDVAAARTAMAFTGTETFADRSILTLSGGERQRVLMARSLAQAPRLLLLDEPTANLDVQHQLQLMELVRVLVGEGMTAVAALHDLDLAARYCDRLILLSEGRVLAEGEPWEVLTPQSLATAFGVHALVHTDPVTDHLVVNVVSSVTPCAAAAPSARGTVHVIGGGGRGARALYLIQSHRYRTTAGVLNEGDSDLAAARMLGINAIAIPSFTAVDDASHAAHLELIARADCVVLADIKFGLANLRNLEAAGAARRLVVVESDQVAARDFTDGVAASRYADLRARARVCGLDELLETVAEVAQEP